MNLRERAIKILGIHYSCNKIIENRESFKKHITRFESIPKKLWRLRDLTLEGRITTFKALALSKIVHFPLAKKS